MSGNQGARIRDLAEFVRSKNAGPFMLTIDLFFNGEQGCQRVLQSNVLTPELIAKIYHVEAQDIKIMHVATAHAIKISFPRPIVAGDIGDSDVSGGQQFAPLLEIIIP